MKTKILAAAAATIVAASANAAVVNTGITGNLDYDGWDALGGQAGYGFGSTWNTPMGSFEAGSGDAELNRTSGTHYSASLGLYSFSSGSTFEINDANALSGLETIILSLISSGAANPAPTLNYNAGSQALAADHSFLNAGVVLNTPAGQTAYDIYTYQWDLSAINASNFAIDFGLIQHTSLRAIELLQSDSFAIANPQVVPVPAAAWLFASSILGVAAVRRKVN